MIKKLIPAVVVASIFLFGACSTNKLAQKTDQVDDAYYTEAQAKEQKEYYAASEEPETSLGYVTDDELYGDYDNTDYNRGDYYDRNFYDQNYSAHINRFRNYSPWRNYYDNYYVYGIDPFNSNFNSFNYYNSPGFGINIGFGSPYGYNYGYNNFYNPWNYYGSQYYNNYWGPVSYYNPFNPYYYGGRYGNNFGGYYGNIGRPEISNPNYRTRPNRETENIRTGVNSPNNGLGERIGTSPSRPERISSSPTETGESSRSVSERPQPVRTSRPTRGNDGNSGNATQERTNNRPAPATSEARPSRPERENAPAQRTENRPAERQYSPPPSSTPSRSNENNNQSSRPSRSGGR